MEVSEEELNDYYAVALEVAKKAGEVNHFIYDGRYTCFILVTSVSSVVTICLVLCMCSS